MVYSYDIDDELRTKIEQLEATSNIDYHEDIIEENYSEHKVGGYPSYTQHGIENNKKYPFVFQISSDWNAELSIEDDGIIYFYYNNEKDEWRVYWDCY